VDHTQVYKYDGTNAPVKITSLNNDGYATPSLPVVDEANGLVYLKAMSAASGKFQLTVLKTDDTYEEIEINASNHGFAAAKPGVLFNGKYYFEGDNGTDDDELFVSDGTAAGTMMLKDINPDGNSNPKEFTIFKDELYFICEVSTGDQIWKTDGTADGTVMAVEPFTGDDGDISYLKVYNDQLFFSATDGTNGVELWSYDGTTAAMVKDLDGAATDGDPQALTIVDDLLFFEGKLNGDVVLWVSNGTSDYTMPVSEVLNTAVYPVKVNLDEKAIVGSILYFSADDANGHDDIYSVNADLIWTEDVVFTVSDDNGPLEDATVEFDGTTATTDASGMVTFLNVRMGTDLPYTVTLDDYEDASGTVSVADATVNEAVTLESLPTYSVIFTVTDGTNPLEGAEISFNSTTGTTDASGIFTFTELLPATDMAYDITKAGYTAASGTVTVVDQDVNVNESLTLIVYTVTFNVTDGTSSLADATISFNGTDQTTDASGSAVFSEVVPGTALAYTVTLDHRYYDSNGTVDVDGDETVDVILALTTIDESLLNTLQVYPNPTSGKVYIDGLEEDATYEIYNVSQQKIAEGKVENAQLDLSVKAGLYLLKISSGDATAIRRVMVK